MIKFMNFMNQWEFMHVWMKFPKNRSYMHEFPFVHKIHKFDHGDDLVIMAMTGCWSCMKISFMAVFMTPIFNGNKSMVSKPLVFLILLCVVMDAVGCYVCCCENQGVWTEWEKQLRRRRFSSAAGSLFGRLATTKPMPAGNEHQTQWPLIIIGG